MDALVRQLVEAARNHTSQALMVCALGGYGRRTLCLHSDVDLLIVFENELTRGEERFVNAVLQPLWDLQLVVGHQVRELRDFDHDNPDLENPEFLMALLDARPIAGDVALFDRVRPNHGAPGGERQGMVESLLELIDQRHAQFNHTLYQLEPDIKSAPGGLRDIAVSRYLRALHPEAFEGESPRAADALQEAEEFLLRVRALLHVEAGRDANVLTHELQETRRRRPGLCRRRCRTVASRR